MIPQASGLDLDRSQICIMYFVVKCIVHVIYSCSKRVTAQHTAWLINIERRILTCAVVECLLSALLKVKAFDGRWLASVLGFIDDGAAASLTEDIFFLFTTLQFTFHQEQPKMHTNTKANVYTFIL